MAIPTEDPDPNRLLDSGQFVFAAAPVLAHVVPCKVEGQLIALEPPLHFAFNEKTSVRPEF